MLGEILPEILIILVLILANGFFAGSEIAIVSARRGRLEQRAQAGERGAQQALDLAANSDRFLATVQVGISLIGTFAAAFGGASVSAVLARALETVPALAPYAEPIALTGVVLLITYFSLVLGELVPKRIALQNAEAVATATAPLMHLVARVARPLVGLLTLSVTGVLRLLGRQRPPESVVTEEDIGYMVREGVASGGVEPGEAQFIQRVFRFSDRPVREVMTPRPNIFAVAAGTPLPDAVSALLDSGHTRVPVYEGSLDQATGILHATALLRAAHGAAPPDLLQLAQPATFVFEQQHIDDALAHLREQGAHMALVLDEYGGVAGLLTLTDLLEELVGALPTEGQAPSDPALVQRADGSWLVDGAEAYRTVQEALGLPPVPSDEQGDYSTLAGLILTRLGRIPSAGESVPVGDWVAEVVDMDGLRIDRVLLRRP